MSTLTELWTTINKQKPYKIQKSIWSDRLVR